MLNQWSGDMMKQIDPERWSTHTPEEDEEIKQIQKRLGELLSPHSVQSGGGLVNPDEITTPEQAVSLILLARRTLLMNLLGLETHEHWLDDCGDDTQAATDLWSHMFSAYFENDAEGPATLAAVKAALTQLREEYGVED